MNEKNEILRIIFALYISKVIRLDQGYESFNIILYTMRIIHQILTQQIFNLVFLNATFKKIKWGLLKFPKMQDFNVFKLLL